VARSVTEVNRDDDAPLVVRRPSRIGAAAAAAERHQGGDRKIAALFIAGGRTIVQARIEGFCAGDWHVGAAACRVYYTELRTQGKAGVSSKA
jgi:hypothetical protein